MRVLVCGGRNFDDQNWMNQELWAIHNKTPISTVIHGGAIGADKCSTNWAREADVRYKIYYAEWDDISVKGAVIKKHANGREYNVLAGIMRNTQMLIDGKPDLVVAFPGGTGTADMIKQSRRHGIEVLITEPPF